MKKYFSYLLFISIVISCKSKKATSSSNEPSSAGTTAPKTTNGLIQDCPEELIINGMPSVSTKQQRNNKYYIYKGERREINEFDSIWVKNNCKVKEMFVQ